MTNLPSILLPILVLLPVLGGLLCWVFGTRGEKKRRYDWIRFRGLVSWFVPTVELLLVILLLMLGFDRPIRFDFPETCGLGLGFTLDGLRWII